VSRDIIPNIREIVRRNLVTRNSAVSSRQFCSAPEEKKDSSEVSEAVQKLTTENEALSKDLASFKEKCNELDDKFKRSLAETENVRRRLTKQKDDAKLFGIQGFCKDLLNVADILERATESVPKDQIGSNVHLKNLYQGLSMTEGELKNVFKRNGLVLVDPLGEKFNPNLHEALFQQPIEGKESGTVIEVKKVGYTLHDRCIRPALVGVAT